MKKKIIAFLMSLGMAFGVCSFTACNDITETLDMAIELEELTLENNQLKKENQALKEEIASLRFELTFPNGLVTESCILNSVKVVRNVVDEDGSIYAVRADGEDVEVTINGGYYDAGSGSLYNIAVWAHHNSKITINGGKFVTGNDINGEANHCVYAAGGSTIEINGGTFMSNGDASWLLNCQDGNGTIIVKGGTFVNFDPSNCVSEGENTNFVAEGYMVVMEEIEGTRYYTVVEAPTVEEPEIESPENF